MPSKRDKTTGLPLPSPVTPASNICVQMTIPNAPEYIQAFRGVLADLGKWWTWSHTVGQSTDNANEAAELWRDLLQSITYSEDCDDPVACIDVTNCINTNAGTQEAIQNQINSQTGQQNVYNTSVYGTPMTGAQRNSSVTPVIEDCEPDSLFGSITSIIDQLNQNNVDFLEVILLSDNAQQRVSKVVKAIPLLGSIVPIDEVLDFVSQMTTEIKENYEAEYTGALRDTYRCDIFCQVKDTPSCEVTFQMLVEYFNNRLGTALEPVNFFASLVQYFIAGTWSGTTVVDIMTLIQLSAWQQASEWSGVSLRSLQTVGLLGANDPDPDWALICEDCPDENWITVDFALGQQGWAPFNSGTGDFASWGGDGWLVGGAHPDQIAIFKHLSPPVLISQVKIYLSEALDNPVTTYVGDYDLTNLSAPSAAQGPIIHFTGLSIADGLGVNPYAPAMDWTGVKLTKIEYLIP